MRWSKAICFAVLFTLAATGSYGQSSVLRTGSWYKVAVANQGVYKITYDQLKKMGFDAGSIDPRKIRLYGQRGGMLPQPNATTRPYDLIEHAIFVAGEADGAFNSGDYILFYAQGPDRVAFDVTRSIFAYEANLYSEQNFYFITVGDAEGKRIATQTSVSGDFPVVDKYNDFVYHEVDSYNELHSGREWFGEQFDLTSENTFDLTIPGIAENTDIRLVSDVMGQSFSSSSFKVYFNNTQIVEQVVPIIFNTQYGVKGAHKRDTVTFSSSTVSAPAASKQQIKYQFLKASSGASKGFLDFFLVSFQRKLALYGDQTIFRSAVSLAQVTSRYTVASATDKCMIWDVSDAYTPAQQQYTLQGEIASFSTATNSLREFVIFNDAVPSPELIGKVDNQDLHGMPTPQVLIITHPDFQDAALRLAQHRSSHSNVTVSVVPVDNVFNEFSSGRQDITALRDLIKHLYDKSSGTLQNVLLFGRGSYDYKDRVADNTNFVPTYESRNSLSPLETYSSDDYLGFMGLDEGYWNETSGATQSHTLDIGIGLLPVKDLTEANHVVDKIIYYDTHKSTYGTWRKKIVFVADDGNNADGFTSDHQSQANSLAETLEADKPRFDTRKIFLGTYTKTVAPNGETIPEANKAIIEDFDRGSLIINYTGHGSEQVWADERVLTDKDIDALDNKLYPFLVTATCEFGRHDDPSDISSAELTVLREQAGSIGLVTTARPVNSTTNFALNRAFYNAVFTPDGAAYPSLGKAYLQTKNNSISGVANRNFSLLADPSQTLAIPTSTVVITAMQTASGSDTLKALSSVHVEGHLENASGTIASDFNGTLEATLFDKQAEFVTVGKNNPAFTFKQWYNALFRGKASVRNGAFQFDFVVPKNISYETGPGKMSLYASMPSEGKDASGAYADFRIGGSETNAPTDNTPPTLQLYMGDTTFVNGGLVTPNTTLLARVEDASGVNISNYGIGNTMVAVLDNDEQVFVLNEYYSANTDDYTKGWINFPVKGLAPGRHRITVKVWDTYNNPAQAVIDFIVTDGEQLVIESFGNYPNPCAGETTFFFTHNRSGDDLETHLEIYRTTGEIVQQYDIPVVTSPYLVNLLEINDLTNNGKKLQPGLYLARLIVRSLTNGSKNEQVAKLIVVN